MKALSLTFLSLCLAACGSSSSGSDSSNPGADTVAPLIQSGPMVIPNPDQRVPLAALAILTTDEPTQVVLAFDDGTRNWEVLAEPEYLTDHQVAVLGMRPELTHSIEVRVRDAAGNETVAAPRIFDTPALPANFPPIEVTQTDPTRTEPGVTLFATRYQGTGQRGNFIIMIDDEGEVIWYYHDPTRNPTNVEVMRDGNLLYMANSTAFEIDRLGNDLGAFHSAAHSTAGAPPWAVLVDSGCFHHELYQLPEDKDADFIALSKEVRVFPDYPNDTFDPTNTSPEADVTGAMVVEFLADGTIVRELSVFDVLDPYRICYGTLQHMWKCQYGIDLLYDWSHANAVLIDDRDDSYIISLRHQDCIFKVDRDTGELKWILGDPGRWTQPWSDKLLTPVGADFEYSYHQHAPEILPNGNLLVFDNGRFRAIPPEPSGPIGEYYSRVVEYEIDETAMTVSQVWSYGGPGEWYSDFFGEADRMPQTGNLLVCDGAKLHQPSGTTYARLLEITQETPAEILFEMFIEDETHALNWGIYRSERIPSVYPETE